MTYSIGRINDMIKRKSLRTEKVKLLAIDELDDMLKESAKDQLYDVFIQLPKGKNSQKILFFFQEIS